MLQNSKTILQRLKPRPTKRVFSPGSIAKIVLQQLPFAKPSRREKPMCWPQACLRQTGFAQSQHTKRNANSPTRKNQILRSARHPPRRTGGGQAQDDSSSQTIPKDKRSEKMSCHFTILSNISRPSSNGMCTTVACMSHLARTLVRLRAAQRQAFTSNMPMTRAPKK